MARSEEAILEEFRRTRNPQLLTDFVLRYMNSVHELVRGMVIDQAEIEDLVQEIFLRAFRGLSNFNGTSKVSTWVHQIALNAALSYMKERKRMDRPAGSLGGRVAAPKDADPMEHAISEETAVRIEVALGNLTPDLRAAIVLTKQLGYTAKEAARIAGCLAPTMHWRIHRARSYLSAELGDLFESGDEP